jgi:hypothetical protein
MSLCKKRIQQLKVKRFRFNLKEVQSDAQNLSTEKASEKKGARLQKKNENC